MEKVLIIFFASIILISCQSNEDVKPKDSDIKVCVKMTEKATDKEVNLTCSTLDVWETGKWQESKYTTYYKNIHYVEVKDCAECQR